MALLNPQNNAVIPMARSLPRSFEIIEGGGEGHVREVSDVLSF